MPKALKSKGFKPKLRLWIDGEKGIFLGVGRVALLEKIKQTGSMSQAAKALKMSYRQAWGMVADMNTRSNEPLVEKVLGGKNGGGALLTKAGEQAIKSFHTIEDKLKKHMDKEFKKLKF